MISAKNGMSRKAYETVGEHKPTEEELIYLTCDPKKKCKGDCKRYREAMRRLKK